jgi:hypothetical protein
MSQKEGRGTARKSWTQGGGGASRPRNSATHCSCAGGSGGPRSTPARGGSCSTSLGEAERKDLQNCDNRTSRKQQSEE